MGFTLTFIELFLYGLMSAAPLLLFFVVIITVIGQVAGRKEGWTRLDSLYWSFITATTVGYGDFRPSQKLTKLLAIFIAFCGLIFTGIIVALAIHAATEAFKENSDLTVKEKIETIRHGEVAQ